MNDIFISYKREEQPAARKLADALQNKGWSVWWDPKLRAGERVDDVIEKALIDAKCVIVMWSKLSVKSRYVKDEATYALNRSKLVPITIDEVDLPFRFEGIHTVRLINWDGSDSFCGYQELVADIESILGEPPSEVGVKTIKESIGDELILIPEGNFMMGSHISAEETAQKFRGDPEWFKAEHPQHKVTISEPFYLQATTVTQGQWEKVMRDNPSEFKDCGDDFPVETVSWKDTQKFIDKLNGMEGADKFRYRLPTEAEWEYACRAGTTAEFSFGEDPSKLSEYAWFSNNSEGLTHPVGTKNPNPRGLYDMHGNVWEWVEDDWHDTYDRNRAPTDGSAWIDEPRGAERVFRGGGWSYVARYCRAANRNYYRPGKRRNFVGFRLASSVVLGP
jgi:formylglycine-generating enzyme required for sulfatase activity